MTREEAKRRLLNIERSIPNTFRTKEDVRNFEALEMAIKALQEPKSPCDLCRYNPPSSADGKPCTMCPAESEEQDYICDTCKHNDKEWDEEPCDGCCGNHSGYEPSGDLISRQVVMDALCDGCELFKNGEQTCFSKCEEHHFLATLPSVKQEPKTGHWITQWNVAHQKEYYYCSECREEFSYDGETGIKMNDYDFCPNCGAKMVEPQEERVRNDRTGKGNKKAS